MFRSVLVPTDFTTEGVELTEFAAGVGSLGVRRAVLANVLDATGMEGPVICAEIDRTCAKLAKRATILASANLHVETRVPTGDPACELMALACETGSDLVAIGTHGKAQFDALVSGSVSETLLRETSIPTLFVRFALLHGARDCGQLARGFGSRLLLPTDFSGSATRALMAVLELPPGSIQTLYLIHVLSPELSGRKLARAEEGAAFALGELAETARQAGVSATTIVRRGEPHRAVLAEVNERRPTGVACGRRGRTALAGAVLGSVSLTLMRQASCPVLVVP